MQDAKQGTARFFLNHIYPLVSSGLLLLALTGCGPREPSRVPVFKASGQVQIDGQPLPNAMVVLHPKNGTVAAGNLRRTRQIPALDI